ncbi:MAG: hypothetical protein ABUT20_62590 [Bacteroidota bacterium]
MNQVADFSYKKAQVTNLRHRMGMNYAGNKENGFNMKDISNGDIKQILNYAKDNMEKENPGKANVEVSGNAKKDLKDSKNIEVLTK